MSLRELMETKLQKAGFWTTFIGILDWIARYQLVRDGLTWVLGMHVSRFLSMAWLSPALVTLGLSFYGFARLKKWTQDRAAARTTTHPAPDTDTWSYWYNERKRVQDELDVLEARPISALIGLSDAVEVRMMTPAEIHESREKDRKTKRKKEELTLIDTRLETLKSSASPIQLGKSEVAIPTKPTLASLFNTDFPTVMKLTDNNSKITWVGGATYPLKKQLYLDFGARTQFVGFYIPSIDPISGEGTYRICMALANEIQNTIRDLSSALHVAGGYPDQMTHNKELTFSGRVFVYHDDSLSITQKAEILKVFSANDCDVQFRGMEHLGPQVAAWYRQHGSR